MRGADVFTLASIFRLYQAVGVPLPLIHHVHLFCLRIEKYEEVVSQKLHLHACVFRIHGLESKFLGGQSAGYINALENRNGFPSMQVFFYICEYLGVTPTTKPCLSHAVWAS